MKPAPFELHRPKTLAEAVQLLDRHHKDGALVLAGGQSLIPMLALRVVYPPHLIDITAVQHLDTVESDGDRLRIGAAVRHSFFQRDTVTGKIGQLLREVCGHIAHYPIRNRGTFCGSLAHADPASEWCLVAAGLDATIRLVSSQGERRIPASEFLRGAMTTSRESNEILVETSLPLLPENTAFGFYEFNRRAGDFAIGACLVLFEVLDGKVTHPRLALCGIEEVARLIPEAAEVLEGQELTLQCIEECAATVAKCVDPMEDPTTSAGYRRDLSAVVTKRALIAARAMAQSLKQVV
jgi:carbon-monoxide dehydrogenase medium subunit